MSSSELVSALNTSRFFSVHLFSIDQSRVDEESDQPEVSRSWKSVNKSMNLVVGRYEIGHTWQADDIKPPKLNLDCPQVRYFPTLIVVNEKKFPSEPRVATNVDVCVNVVSLNTNIAINVDIKEMFSQVRIIKEDQHYQRFLWHNGVSSRELKAYILQSRMYGPVCSPSWTQHVKNSHVEKFVAEVPEAVKAIMEHTYVDDLMNNQPDVANALKFANNRNSFDLISFQSKSRECLNQLPMERVKNSLVNTDRDERSIALSELLRICWNTTTADFTFKVSHSDFTRRLLQVDYVLTMREIVKALVRIFESLDLIAHSLIPGRKFLQDIWKQSIGCDQQVFENLVQQMRNLLADRPSIEAINSPSQHAELNPHDAHVQLIVFVDASEQAYATTGLFSFRYRQQFCSRLGKGKICTDQTSKDPATRTSSSRLRSSTQPNDQKARSVQGQRNSRLL
jgi:Pao retrotransposon peptidase